MIFYSKPFKLSKETDNKDIKKAVKTFRNGNFKKASVILSKIDKNNLSKEDREEYDKLKKMLSIDKAGIFAVMFLITIIIILLADYSKI